MEDKQILAMLFSRTEGAIVVLMERFGKQLYRIAMNILDNHHDAQESVNDTYFALWNAIPPATPDPLAPYVYRSGRNIALKHRRKNSAQKRNGLFDVPLEELEACLPSDDLESQNEIKALGQAIDRFLDAQSREDRVLFLRRYWLEDSVKAVADTMHLTENAVSVRLNRIRKRLKEYLIKEGYLYEARTDRSGSR